MEKFDVEELKKSVQVLDVLGNYGVHAKREGKDFKAKCPFHEDKKPSLSVSSEKNLWNCFGCGRGGSVFDLVMEFEGIDFNKAAEKIFIEHGQGRIQRGSDLEKNVSVDPRLLLQVIEHYEKTLAGKDRRGLEYLKKRGLGDVETLKHFRVGFVNGTLSKVLPESAIEPLKKIGLLRKDGKEHFEGFVIVPAFTASGEVGEIYGRSVEGCKHLYLPGEHRGLINRKAASIYDEIILTEAALDAMALFSIGFKNVIPCFGTGGFTAEHREALKIAKVLFFAFDHDEAGEKGAKKIADSLELECRRVLFPKNLGKDANEWVRCLKQQGMSAVEVKAAFDVLLKKAKRFGFVRERGSKLTLKSQDEQSLFFENGEISYRLRGLFENNATSLRVVLTAKKYSNLQTLNSELSHTDRFDLYTARSRGSFSHRTANRLEVPAAKIEEDLSVLIPMLEAIKKENQGKEETVKLPPMSPGDRREAGSFLKSPRLFERIADDLEIVGYVGERKPKQLSYLIGTSRKLLKPLSAIIRSESGAGKSFLMECVAELMPPEEVQYFSRLTPQSLYYMGKDELAHKLLIVDERDGSEEAEYPIRTLQTRRKLTLAVPVKDPSSGKTKTVMLEIFGPIAYMESSTQQHINPENLNRGFEVYLDESGKQTERIYQQQKKAHQPEGWEADARRERVLRVHRNAQRLLESLKVSIPFVELLKFPAAWTRGRRDHERFLSLVEVIAFVHQFQREKKMTASGVEYIEATPEDYAKAYGLAMVAFSHALDELPRNGALVLSHIRALVKERAKALNVAKKEIHFRRRDVREFSRLPDHQIKRAMQSLEDLEYVHVWRSGRGGSFVYRLAAEPAGTNPLDGLTTPEGLFKMLKSGTKVEQGGCSTLNRG